MLIAFGGLPGAGKSTIAALVAARLGAVYLRIDTIEQAIRAAKVLAGDVEGSGYLVARQLAAENLRLGRIVIVDCVNPLNLTREMFRSAADENHADLLEVEVVCSDPSEHRRRVETRTVAIPGLRPPTWDEVVSGDYESWPLPHLKLDTFGLTPEECARLICREADERLRRQAPS